MKLNDKQVTLISLGVIAGIALIILVVCYFECKKIGDFEGLPSFLRVFGKKSKKSVTAEIARLNAAIKTHEAIIERETALLDEKKTLQNEWDALNEELPKSTDFLELQNKIMEGAEENNIEIKGGISRSKPIPYDANTMRIDMKLIDMEGTFHDFGNFLYFLYVHLKRFIVLQEVSIKSGSPDVIEDPTEKIKHKISLGLVTFTEKTQ